MDFLLLSLGRTGEQCPACSPSLAAFLGDPPASLLSASTGIFSLDIQVLLPHLWMMGSSLSQKQSIASQQLAARR